MAGAEALAVSRARLTDLSSFESEAVRYGLSILPDPKKARAPGPGSYEIATEDMAAINVNLTSNEGTFAKAERVLHTKDGENIAPGPQHYPPPAGVGQTGIGPTTVFSKASRFPEQTRKKMKHNGSPYMAPPDMRQNKTWSSVEGTLSRAVRPDISSSSCAPGYKYEIDRSLVKKGGSRKGTMGKASRFTTPEDEESPGPAYLPKPLLGPHGPRFTASDRFSHEKTVPMHGRFSPGPTTATREAYEKWAKQRPPAYSMAARGKTWVEEADNIHSPGPLGYNTQDHYSTAHKNSPAYSFAPPRTPQTVLGTRRGIGAGTPPPLTRSGAGSPSGGSPRSPMASSPGGLSPMKQKLSSGGEAMPKQRFNRTTNEQTVGVDSPGPALYTNIFRLFGPSHPQSPSARIIGPVKPPAGHETLTPGPGAYETEKFDPKRHGSPGPTFGRTERKCMEVESKTPGPLAYNGGAWTKKTPIRHGVSTQTTNYVAKAEVLRKAKLLHVEKERQKELLTRLQMDYPPLEDQSVHLPFQPKDPMSDLPSRDDKFLVNIFYA